MIAVTVTAEQPLLLGSRPDSGWLGDTHRFVPGSVLRGALAAAWIAEHPAGITPGDDPEFRALFESSVRYGPLYGYPNALRPLSVFGCKYQPTSACRDVAVDAAFTAAVPDTCYACDRSPMEASKGQVDGVELVERTQVRMREDADQAATGGLFSRQALRAGSILSGHVLGDHPWLTARPSRRIRLGGRRSTSGLAVITLTTTDPDPAATFTGLDPSRGQLVVRLLSPAILVDDAGRPQWRPSETRLAELLGVGTRIAAEWVRPVGVGGWHAAANLPKPRDLAVAAGSVYVLGLDATPDQAALDQLYQTGLGLRRGEGFGWVSLDQWLPCPPTPAERPPDPKPTQDETLVSDLIAHDLLGLVLDDLRQRAETGPGPLPDTRRYRDLPAGARELVERVFALDRVQMCVIVTLLDIADREVFR